MNQNQCNRFSACCCGAFPSPCPPPCPTPEFPDVICTPAFASFAQQLVQVPPTAVSIPNAFNTNDGPAPYTVLSATLTGLQLPLANLTITPAGGNNYNLTAIIAPMVRVTYLDGNSVQRSKFIQIPLSLSTALISLENPDSIRFWAFLESGSVSNLGLSGTTLTFTAAASVRLEGLAPEPDNYAALQGLSCSQQPPLPAECLRLRPLDGYCSMSGFLDTLLSFVPFQPLGQTPYSNAAATLTESEPYVLRTDLQSGGISAIDLAFPIVLRYTDGSGQTQTQATFVYTTLLFTGLTGERDSLVIVDAVITNLGFPFGPITTTVLRPNFLTVSGTIRVMAGFRDVPVTSRVQCGGAPMASSCLVIVPPPTLEMTV